jgi:hypothetical protein
LLRPEGYAAAAFVRKSPYGICLLSILGDHDRRVSRSAFRVEADVKARAFPLTMV